MKIQAHSRNDITLNNIIVLMNSKYNFSKYVKERNIFKNEAKISYNKNYIPLKFILKNIFISI